MLESDAMALLTAALRSVSNHICLQAGDLLVLDNRYMVHARTAYHPRWDGKDRWLHACYTVASLDHLPDGVQNTQRVVDVTGW